MATQSNPDDVVTALGVVKAGQSARFDDLALSIGVLSNGWTVAWAADETFFDETRALELSNKFSLVAGWVNETVMCSSVRYFEKGKQVWAVWHNGDDDPLHIEHSGKLPEVHQKLIAEAKAKYAEDDEVDWMIDVPLNLGQHVCGFHPEDETIDNIVFQELAVKAEQPSLKKRKGFLSWLI